MLFVNIKYVVSVPRKAAKLSSSLPNVSLTLTYSNNIVKKRHLNDMSS